MGLCMMLGCQRTIEDNKGLLPRDKMVSLLIDIHILEAKVNKLRLKSDSAKAVYNTFEEKIFLDHNVDRAVYDRSLQYYLIETKELKKVYQVVIDSLNLRQKSASLESQSTHDKKTEKLSAKKKALKTQSKDSIPVLIKKEGTR